MQATAHLIDFGHRIQMLRRERKMTQIDLSQSSQLSKAYISFLENGVRQPSREVVARLAESLLPGEDALLNELLGLAGFASLYTITLPQPAPSFSLEDFRSYLGNCLRLIRQRDFSQAQKEIEKGFDRFRRPAQMQTLLAHLELARGAFEQAVLFQRTALQHYDLGPDEQDEGLKLVDFILNLGVMYFLWGEHLLFASLSETNPRESASLRNRAFEHYQQALDSFEQALLESPGHLYVLDEAGRVHVNLADLQSGEPAEFHWHACIAYFRQVLAHPHKHKQLSKANLRESAAFLAIAYAKQQDFTIACLLLDALSLDSTGPWIVPYAQSCCALLEYRVNPLESLLEQALLGLQTAFELDPETVRATFEHDARRDLAPLLNARSQDVERILYS